MARQRKWEGAVLTSTLPLGKKNLTVLLNHKTETTAPMSNPPEPTSQVIKSLARQKRGERFNFAPHSTLTRPMRRLDMQVEKLRLAN